MKKRLQITAIILSFAVGIGLLLYPRISKVINAVISRNMATAYIERMESLPDAEMEALLEQAQSYNDSLLGDASGERTEFDYEEILSTDKNGLIGYVEIPKINVYLPIYHGTSDDVLKRGAGHVEGTSLPIGGENTHSVISAHSGYPTKTFFDYLTELQEGDVFYVHVLNQILKYEVAQVKIVLPTDMTELDVIEGEDHVTLLTCTPYSINTHRLLVRGIRVSNDETVADITPIVLHTGEGTFYFFNYAVSYVEAVLTVCVLGAVVVILIVWHVQKKRKQNRRIDYENKAEYIKTKKNKKQ